MVQRNCNYCQKVYLAVPAYLARGEGIYCSRACSGKGSGLKKIVKHDPNVKCAWCQVEFYKKPSHAKKSKSGLYFCTKEHMNEATRASMIKCGPMPTVLEKGNCIFCNQKVSKRSRLDNHKECEKENKIKQWLNGNNEVTISYSKLTKNPRDTQDFVKEHLLKTRGDRCEECGFDQKRRDGVSIIQMDHVNGNCFDNRPENLKLLCPNCHAMTDTYGARNRGSGRAHRRKEFLKPS